MDPLGQALLNQVAADREGVLIIRLGLSSSHKLFQLSCLDLFQRLHCWDFSAWIHRYRDWVLVTKTSFWILLQSESWFSRPLDLNCWLLFWWCWKLSLYLKFYPTQRMNLVHCITIQSFNLRREATSCSILDFDPICKRQGFLSNEWDFLPAHASSTVLMFWQNDKCHKQPFPDVAFQRGEDMFWIGSKSLGFFFQNSLFFLN